MPEVLWATTYCKEMWETSASHLIESFQATRTPGKLVAYVEGIDPPGGMNVEGRRLEEGDFLPAFLKKNAEVIPDTLGGTLKPPYCKCRRGPFDVHSKNHRLPCPGYWFCKNAFRWLRKVLSANLAADEFHKSHDILMWVDSDASFLKQTPPEVVESWFRGKQGQKYGCVYVKNKRSAIETGVVGYHLKYGGRQILSAMLRRYSGDKFRKDYRWDDCVQLELAIADVGRKVKTADLATAVGPNNTVLQFSPLGEYLGHDKGLHRRSGVLD